MMFNAPRSPLGQGRAIHDSTWIILFFGVTFTTAFLLKIILQKMRNVRRSLRSRLNEWRQSRRPEKTVTLYVSRLKSLHRTPNRQTRKWQKVRRMYSVLRSAGKLRRSHQ
jgi:hypothetical protein